jgi:hypothetical protein
MPFFLIAFIPNNFCFNLNSVLACLIELRATGSPLNKALSIASS